MPLCLATRVSCAAHSRTCATEPGADCSASGIERLDRIDHRDRGLVCLHRGLDFLELDLGEQRARSPSHRRRAARAQRDLLRRFLAADVEHLARGAHARRAPAAATSTCRCPDRRRSAPRRRRPARRPARGRIRRCRWQARLLARLDFGQALQPAACPRSAAKRLRRTAAASATRFHERVPRLAMRALALPLQRLPAALGARVDGLRFSHGGLRTSVQGDSTTRTRGVSAHSNS